MTKLWTKKQQKAVEFSFAAHEGQKRKGTKIDYISHPMIVGLILARIGADDNQIIAGILHDIIEDTDFTKEDIEDAFDEDVADLVEEVSETDRDLPYVERKERAAAKLFIISDRAATIKAADVLSNITDLEADLERKNDEAFNIFHADKSQKIKQISRVVNILKTRVENEDLINSIEETFKKIKAHEN